MGIFPTEGCVIGSIDISSEKKSIMDQVTNGNAFVNPTKENIDGVSASVASALTSVDNCTSPSIFNGLTGALTTLRTNLTSYVSHSNRLSGVVLGATGPNGEPGLNGLVGTAKAYNSICESVTGGVKDNFSPIFNSILGPGSAKLNTIKQKIDNQVINFININSSRTGTGSGFITELTAHISNINTSATNITNLITSDNSAYTNANQTIQNYNVGNMLISSSNDPCFTEKLINNISSLSMKEKLSSLQ